MIKKGVILERDDLCFVLFTFHMRFPLLSSLSDVLVSPRLCLRKRTKGSGVTEMVEKTFFYDFANIYYTCIETQNGGRRIGGRGDTYFYLAIS